MTQLPIIKEWLDGRALDMGRIAFIKAYGGFWGYESQSPEDGWDKVLDILEHNRLQAERDASHKRFYEKEKQKQDRKTQKSQRGPKNTSGPATSPNP